MNAIVSSESRQVFRGIKYETFTVIIIDIIDFSYFIILCSQTVFRVSRRGGQNKRKKFVGNQLEQTHTTQSSQSSRSNNAIYYEFPFEHPNDTNLKRYKFLNVLNVYKNRSKSTLSFDSRTNPSFALFQYKRNIIRPTVRCTIRVAFNEKVYFFPLVLPLIYWFIFFKVYFFYYIC